MGPLLENQQAVGESERWMTQDISTQVKLVSKLHYLEKQTSF